MNLPHPPHKRVVSSDNVSVLLGTALEAILDGAIFSFPLPGHVVVSALPPANGSIHPGNVHTTGLVALYHAAILMSSSVGIAFSSSNLAA
jgi:hypothetical protein